MISPNNLPENRSSKSGKWYSLSFYNEGSSLSELKFIEISNNNYGIQFYNTSPEISNSFISKVEQLEFFGNSSPTISNSIMDSYIVFLDCYDSSAPVLTENIIYDRITCYDQSKPIIQKNNYLGEVLCGGQSTPVICHNDYYEKWAPIICFDEAIPHIEGSVGLNPHPRGYVAPIPRTGTRPGIISSGQPRDIRRRKIGSVDQPAESRHRSRFLNRAGINKRAYQAHKQKEGKE